MPVQIPPTSPSSTLATTLPPALLAQSARRLRIWAVLYAFTFFMVGVLPVFLLPVERAEFLATPLRWVPPLLSVVVAVAVAFGASSPIFAGSSVVRLGLLFQVAGSFGIAAAEYLAPAGALMRSPMAGLSWVAVWVLSFTVTVPSPPRWALFSALGSVSAVPLMVGASIAFGHTAPIQPLRFALHIVVPYLLVVLIAYVGATLVYRLGVDLKRALDLGSYRLVERLGYGGMGEVWRAQHRHLARPAAVKLIRPEVLESATDTRQVELGVRFEREAQTIAQLQSPHTVDLFDYGVADDGGFYYVMELLEGFDLKSLVERFGPMPPERAVHLLGQVCHSLAEAHAAGIVHRDITPANVFVCRYGRDVDFVKVLDFGLVKPQGPVPAGGGETKAGAVGGTPAFMSPEQALGQRLDGRSDLYAVGCLAFWLVTGQTVFPKATPTAMLIAHAQAPPDPPSQRT
ncbi:MAG TPA: serine/threonine-protein kinase, partial [Luteitalea sp.]|nr:serine/threonine-protein kinase [Luteitalea sp.]